MRSILSSSTIAYQIVKMAVDYKRYLAENVLSERRTVSTIMYPNMTFMLLISVQVTYRLLSLALRVHSNLAKQ
jgi:DNA polymerase delta subunit 3